MILTSFIPAGSLSAISLSCGFLLRTCFNSILAALSSSILLLKSEIATGLPPKLPPEPKVKLSTPYILPTLSRKAFVISGEETSRDSPGNKLIVKLPFDEPGPIRFIIFSITGRLPVCFLVYWSFICQALFSIFEIIESVIISLVP